MKKIIKALEAKTNFKFELASDDVYQTDTDGEGYITKSSEYIVEASYMTHQLDRVNDRGESYKNTLFQELTGSPYRECFISNFDEFSKLVERADMPWISDTDCLSHITKDKEMARKLLMELRGLKELPNSLPSLDEFNQDLIDWGVSQDDANFLYADERRIYGMIRSIYDSLLTRESEAYLDDMLPTPPKGFRWNLDYDRHGIYYINLVY